MAVIETSGLTKVYTPAPDTEIRALDGIDLAIDAGEIYGLLGPNGAGKTTLMSILSTLLIPTSGWARVAGQDVVVSPAEVRRQIGVTFQETVLDQQLTGRQVLHFHGALYGMSRQAIIATIEELADLVELSQALDRKVSGYSGGMKRRLELIRGLLTHPAVLFLDEPTQGLDPQNRAAIWRYLADLRRTQNLTLLLTTHYMEEAEVLADRVGIIDKGRLIQQGPPKELVAALGQDVIVVTGSGAADAFQAQAAAAEWVGHISRHEQTGTAGVDINGEINADIHADTNMNGNTGNIIFQIGVANGATHLTHVVHMASSTGFSIRELSVNRPTLGDVFLAATGSTLRD